MLYIKLLLIVSAVYAHNVVQIQYFRRPVEYGIFRVTIGGSRQWESFIYMNKSVNLREEEIYKVIKPFFEQEPSTGRYESASITRHLGTQFEYILKRYKVEEIIFENLCSQMKPKFSVIIAATTQAPKKIKWIVEHPSAPFTIPSGFTKNMGRDEYQIEIGGRARFNEENFDFDSIKNTQKLIVKQTSEFKTGVDSNEIFKIQSPDVYIEGNNEVDVNALMAFAKQWLNGERKISKWDVHLNDKSQNEQYYFEKDEKTLDISLKNGHFLASTYNTPKNHTYQFSVL